MYKFVVVYNSKETKEFNNIVSIRVGSLPMGMEYSDEKISELPFDGKKPIFLFDNEGRSYLIPEKSFRSLACEIIT